MSSFWQAGQLGATAPDPAEFARYGDAAPNPAEVRDRLLAMHAQARGAAGQPWSHKDRQLYRVAFQRLAEWLPEEEARQLCLAFDTELARLEAADGRRLVEKAQ